MNYTDLLTRRKFIVILNLNTRLCEYKWKNKVEIEKKINVKCNNEENNNTKIVENNEELQ